MGDRRSHARGHIGPLRWALLLLAATLISGCTTSTGGEPIARRPSPVPPCASPPLAASGFITLRGHRFCRDGAEIRLRGINFNNESALGAEIGAGSVDAIDVSEQDYARVQSWGANHVRFGLSFDWYRKDPGHFFAVFDRHVGWAASHGLVLIPVMFTTPGACYEGYGTSCPFWRSATEQRELQRFWVDLASHYATQPVVAGFDLLNEPTPPGPVAQRWWPLAQQIRDAIAAVAPNQFVVIEPGPNGRFDRTLGPQVVYSEHQYAPLSITTEGKYAYPGPAPDYDGRVLTWDKASMALRMPDRLSIPFLHGSDLPVLIGEFGCRPVALGYLQYLSDQIDLIQSWGAGWTFFDYREPSATDFGIYTGPPGVPTDTPSIAVKADVVDLLRRRLPAG